jgi:AsmA protein
MRRAAAIIVIVVVVIVVVAGIFVATININRYQGTIEADLTKRLGRNVTLGQMHLSIFPFRLVAHDVSIADDPGFHTGKPFVQAQELAVSVKLLPLLHKAVEIRSLYLQRPSVDLIKNSQGVWNFSSLGAPSSGTPTSDTPTSGTPSSGAPSSGTPSSGSSGHEQLSLSKLVIEDGQVAVTDEQARTGTSTYNHIDATLSDFAPGRPFSIQAALRPGGSGNQALRLTGSGGPIRNDQPAATPFHGTLDLQQVAISDARQFVKSPALEKADGRLSGHTNINSDNGTVAATGSLNVQNARIDNRDLGYPIAVQYSVHDNVPADLLTIDSATVKLGTTPVQFSGTVNMKPTPAQVDLRAKTGTVPIAELAKLAATSGTALTPGANVSGMLDANIEARGPADNPALNGTIQGRDIQIAGKDFPQPVHVNTLDLTLTPTAIRSNPFSMTSGATSIDVQFALQQYTSQAPVFNASLRAPNAELPAVLSIAKAYGVTALNNISGAGSLNLDLHAAGPIHSFTPAAMARELNGTVALNFHDVRYSGADISHELAAIAGIVGMHQQNQGFTNISKMTGNIAIKNGIAQTNNTAALLEIGNVGIAGTANLIDQSLNLRVNAVLSKELTQQAGGTNIGGYLKTVLANSQGQLVIPAIVTGTFQHPRFTPDLQQVAQMKLKGLMPNFSNPTSAISGLLGNLLKQQVGNQNPSQQERSRSANPLEQLQNLFGGKQGQPPKK